MGRNHTHISTDLSGKKMKSSCEIAILIDMESHEWYVPIQISNSHTLVIAVNPDISLIFFYAHFPSQYSKMRRKKHTR